MGNTTSEKVQGSIDDSYPETNNIHGDLAQLRKFRSYVEVFLDRCQRKVDENTLMVDPTTAIEIFHTFRMIEGRIIGHIHIPYEYLKETLEDARFFMPYHRIRNDFMSNYVRGTYFKALIGRLDILEGHIYRLLNSQKAQYKDVSPPPYSPPIDLKSKK